MAQKPTSFRGPFAILAEEGEIGIANDDHNRAYRALMPPATDTLLVVEDADIGAYEAAMQAHAAGAIPALPRLVASHDRVAAFPYLPGVSLRELAAQARELDGEMPLEVAVYIVANVARARAALRGYASQHPITSANVRVGFDGALQLFVQREYRANFDTIIGIIQHEPLWQPRTMPTESTLLPEEADGGAGAPGAADVFALGSLLHFLVEGSHPFAAESMQATLDRLREGSPNPLRPPAPPALVRVHDRALARDPNARQANGAVLAAELAAAVDLTGAREACGGLAAALFPNARREQLLFVEDAGVAALDGTVEIKQFRWQPTGRIVDLAALAGRALWVDERLVTNGALADFVKACRVRPEPNLDAAVWSIPALGLEPAVVVSPVVAAAFAAEKGGRLPTEEEWLLLATRGGVRDLTRVWEWTSTRANKGGFVVRGGPWRNRNEPGRVDNRSWEDVAAPDVGFRVVYDSEPDGVYISRPNE